MRAIGERTDAAALKVPRGGLANKTVWAGRGRAIGERRLSSVMATTLITGANRGIGLELARLSLAAGDTVIGTARDPDGAAGLRESGYTLSLHDALPINRKSVV